MPNLSQPIRVWHGLSQRRHRSGRHSGTRPSPICPIGDDKRTNRNGFAGHSAFAGHEESCRIPSGPRGSCRDRGHVRLCGGLVGGGGSIRHATNLPGRCHGYCHRAGHGSARSHRWHRLRLRCGRHHGARMCCRRFLGERFLHGTRHRSHSDKHSVRISIVPQPRRGRRTDIRGRGDSGVPGRSHWIRSNSEANEDGQRSSSAMIAG